MSKLMMLVAAKWREFSTTNPHLQQDSSVESDYTPKTSRSRGSTAPVTQDEEEEQDDEDERSDDKGRKKRGRKKTSSKKAGGKVPTLKIKIGKRKRGSSVSLVNTVNLQTLLWVPLIVSSELVTSRLSISNEA
jgi:chromodomain-helicase-DNA-binding protein 4